MAGNVLFKKGADSFFEGLKRHYDKKRIIYERCGFSPIGTITFRDWEVLTAILMKDECKPGNGSDLKRHEVKSAKMGNSFEYQYHKHTGLEKLEEEKSIDHIFISYSDHYDEVELRRMKASELSETFDQWRSHVIESYQGEKPKQRCRHSISYVFVKTHGELLWKPQH